MMAMLWAQKIISQESMEKAQEVYAKVPRLLKKEVTDLIIESGMKAITEK